MRAAITIISCACSADASKSSMTAKSRSARSGSPRNAALRFESIRCSCTPTAPSRIARTSPARRARVRGAAPHFDDRRNRPPPRLCAARVPRRADSRDRGLRPDLSRHRLEPQPQGRDQGIPARRPRPARRGSIGPAEVRVQLGVVQVGPFPVSRRIAHARLVPPSEHRAGLAVFRGEQDRVYGDGIRCGTTPGRMDPHPPAARAKRRARHRHPASRRPGSHSSHRLLAPRHQARQRLHSRRRFTRAARLRFRAHRFVGRGADRNSHPGLRADRAISLAGPVEAVERVRQDMLPPALQASDRNRYSAELLTAIDWALVSHEEQRPQSVAEFRSALSGLATADPKTATDRKTVRTQDLRQASAPPTTLPTGVTFDRDTLKRIEGELAKHIGPIASVVIRAAAKKTYTIAGLAETVSVDIVDEKLRAAFVRRFSGDKSTPTGDPARAGAAPQQSVPSSASNIDTQTLARAEAALAQYIGAVAKVVVRRAAAKARDTGELYLLIAEEIEDKNERKTFIRKAISASGKE